MTSEFTQQRTVGRPRSEATRDAILAATIELLEQETYQDISINGISAKANVAKQSILRWWPSKADLVLEAYTQRSLKRIPVPEPTDDVLADLATLLVIFFDALRDPMVAKTMRSLIAEAQFDSEFRDKFYNVFISTRRSLMRQVIEQGKLTGQLRDDADIELALDIVHGAFWYRFLSGTSAQLNREFADGIVATIRPSLERPGVSLRRRQGQPQTQPR